ncbi:hypothetical protein HGM15179_005705 [Zosterops borbonicus]|uniref:LysM and putative peptidoglycan-binding domain-containing protein 2 n=1 Tax=Zosterops borbonicus TaxID=364589 RepID=A0A8K1LPK4_9PASS|nr:hypothetical protein HGM15179_005705 [Zosterops borbonicus]
MAEALRPEPAGGPESEAELSQRLARTKARSYGSTASVAAPLAERYVEHRLSAGDTLQGIALKYGVTPLPISKYQWTSEAADSEIRRRNWGGENSKATAETLSNVVSLVS